jgi:hypothetical protein
MNLLQARLAGNRRRRVLVERAEVTGELELLVDVDLLIPEDYLSDEFLI